MPTRRTLPDALRPDLGSEWACGMGPDRRPRDERRRRRRRGLFLRADVVLLTTGTLMMGGLVGCGSEPVWPAVGIIDPASVDEAPTDETARPSAEASNVTEQAPPAEAPAPEEPNAMATGDLTRPEPIDAWTAWRGPTGDGQVPPVWSEDGQDVHGPNLADRLGPQRWRLDLPGGGHGSPVVYQSRIYLTGFVPEDETYHVYAIDRADGTLVWDVTAHQAAPPAMHESNTPASATPVADADGVTVLFEIDGRLVLTAFDTDGKRRWRTDLGPSATMHGPNGSPIPVGDLLVVQADNKPDAYLVAVERATGRVVWRQPRPEGLEASYATPLVIRESGRAADADQPTDRQTDVSPTWLFVTGVEQAALLDAKTGRTVATVPIDSTVAVTTPIRSGRQVVFSFGYPNSQLRAVDLDAMRTGQPDTRPRGDRPDPPPEPDTSPESHTPESGDPVRWTIRKPSQVPYVPSPVIAAGRVIVAQDEGLVSAIDLETGEVVWKERFGSGFMASPSALGGDVLFADRAGRLAVVDVTGAKPVVKTERTCDAEITATPAVLPDGLIVRAERTVIHFGLTDGAANGTAADP